MLAPAPALARLPQGLVLVARWGNPAPPLPPHPRDLVRSERLRNLPLEQTPVVRSVHLPNRPTEATLPLGALLRPLPRLRADLLLAQPPLRVVLLALHQQHQPSALARLPVVSLPALLLLPRRRPLRAALPPPPPPPLHSRLAPGSRPLLPLPHQHSALRQAQAVALPSRQLLLRQRQVRAERDQHWSCAVSVLTLATRVVPRRVFLW